ncbi:MAG TPA: ABC transporter substrate-binding protein [Burkholderiales bacterium]|nr:ABC transporter substrate-binding protein [Burkholderiales bacterium]
MIALLVSAAPAAPTAVLGQSRGSVPRIGYLTIRVRGHRLEGAFLAGMLELGYVEGKNITIEWRFADGRAERLPALAAELVARRPDLIVTASTQAIEAAKAATTTIPLVFPANADPVGAGFVKSLSRPGTNITGLSSIAADLGAKQIELLRAVLPRLSRVALLVNPTNAGNVQVIRSFEMGAREAGVSITVFEANRADAIDGAFSAMARAKMDAVAMAIDGIFSQEAKRITQLALTHKLPLISPQQTGGDLMSYGARLTENYRRASIYVDKILKGAKPTELPVEQPAKVELVVNLKTAKALGIAIPQSVLLRADQVIE